MKSGLANGTSVAASVGGVIGEAARSAFDENGAVCLRQVIADQWIDALRGAVDEGIAHPSEHAKCYTGRRDLGRYLLDFWVASHSPVFAEFCRRSNAAGIAAGLIGEMQARFIFDSWIIKYPGTMMRTPWHQDWGIVGRSLAIWIPLDPTPKTASLEVVAGSHLWHKQFYEGYFADDFAETAADPAADLTNPDGSHPEPLPDIEKNRSRYNVLSWNTEPGDCIVFDSLVVHGAPGNPNMAPVRRYVCRWAEPAAVLAPSGKMIAERMRQRSGLDMPIRQDALLPFDGEDFPLLPALEEA